MLDDKSLLEICLKTSGSFENGGGAQYNTVSGNFDGQGMSCGILQWNAGQGTLQQLVQAIGTAMGWDRAQTFFTSDIHHFSMLPPADAIAWCLDHYIEVGTKNVDPGAKAKWQTFLTEPEAVAAQIQLATTTTLSRAKALVAKYTPDFVERSRPYAFFFDVVTQQGGMQVRRISVPIVALGHAVFQPALDLANVKNLKCAGMWQQALQGDNLAQLLLYYGFARASMGNPLYVWDSLSRRGSIACRTGIVHEGVVNLENVID